MKHIFRTTVAGLGLCISLLSPALGQENPFAGGWVLTGEGSTLGFQSVKKATNVEQSGFAIWKLNACETGTFCETNFLERLSPMVIGDSDVVTDSDAWL